MLMRRATTEYRKREGEIYDKIREASEEFARLSEAGMDTTEALRRLEAALAEFELFRKNNRYNKISLPSVGKVIELVRTIENL